MVSSSSANLTSSSDSSIFKPPTAIDEMAVDNASLPSAGLQKSSMEDEKLKAPTPGIENQAEMPSTASEDGSNSQNQTPISQSNAGAKIKRQPSNSLNKKIALDRRSVYELLKYEADELKFYYTSIETKSTYGPRFVQASTTIWHAVTAIEPKIDDLGSMASQYDFDPQTPGNGVRSLIKVFDSCALHLLRIYKEIHEQRSGLLFRGNFYLKELEAFAGAFVVLVRAGERVYEYLKVWPSDELFASEDLNRQLRPLMAEIESLDQSPFYGRTMGFQFCASLLQVFQVIGISLASYSLLWDEERPSSTSITGAASNLLKSGQYAINPEERAKRIFQVTLNADISFCKAFWNLTEGMLLQELPRWLSPHPAFNEMWQIPGDLSLSLETIDGRKLEVPPPSAYSGTRNLPIRVISHHLHDGMPAPNISRVFKTQTSASNILPKSPTLLFHVHGGGFVATSSKTHEPYLRHWAKSLNCPIVSVDYSLAPEHPYPRATEEIYYAYAWVLANADKLGWTGERICVAGDSAGGLLLASTTLRLIKRHIRRLPDGLVLIYPTFLAQYSPSPSRLLSLLDPLLPLGVVSRCVAAYTGNVDYLKSDTATAESTSAQEDPATATQAAAGNSPPKKQVSRDSAVLEHDGDASASSKSDQEIVNFFKWPPQQKQQLSNNGTESGMDAVAAESEPMETENPKSGNLEFVLSTSDEEDQDEKSQELENAKTEQVAENLREFFHRQLSRTSGGRGRSQSENFVRITSDKRERSEDSVSSSSEESNGDDVSARIGHDVPRDPKLIVFTAVNYEEPFLDYLRDHEATRPSFRRLTTPASIPKEASELAEKKPQDESANDVGEEENTQGASIDENRHIAAGHIRSQSTGSLVSLTRASASIGHKMGLYVMDSLNGWFNPGHTFDVHGMFNSGGMASGGRPKVGESKASDSPLAKFHNMPVPRDPFLSPLLAPDEWLAKFPRTAILACHLDPLLDDSVSFAKHLKRSGANVSLDLVDSLPHGFLNFAMFSPECREAARICVQRIREILQPPPNRDRNSPNA